MMGHDDLEQLLSMTREQLAAMSELPSLDAVDDVAQGYDGLTFHEDRTLYEVAAEGSDGTESVVLDWLPDALECAHELGRLGYRVTLLEHFLGEGSTLTAIGDDGRPIPWGEGQ